jgi:hypothetical protein
MDSELFIIETLAAFLGNSGFSLHLERAALNIKSNPEERTRINAYRHPLLGSY